MSRVAWVIVIVIAVLVILSLAASFVLPLAYGPGYGGYGYGWGMMGPWMMGGMMGGGIWMILFWVLILGGGVWLVQSLGRSTGSGLGTPRGESLLEILQRRYASGEISKEQFDQARRDLGV